MEELSPERAALKQALDEMRIESFVFERDAGARSQSIEDTFFDEVEAADLYIGVFWKGYGRYTIDEYERADALGMDCLIYEKREGVEDQRDPQLAAFLSRLGAVETGRTVKWFHTPAELTEAVKDDVARWQAEKVREATSPSGTRLFVDVPRTPLHLTGRGELLLDVVRKLKSGRDVALTGLPGVGKTTFAAAVARHRGVLRHFRDGVLWGSVGPVGNTGRVRMAWISALSVPLQAQSGEGTEALRKAIGSRSLLIVIDDVWQAEAAQLSRVAGPNCVTLLTSRDLGIARSFAGVEGAVEVAPLDEDTAFGLLCQLAPQACTGDESRARIIARKLGGLPLAVELVAGFLAAPEHSVFRELVKSAFDRIADPAERLQLAFNRLGGEGPAVTLQEALAFSLTGLPQPAVDAFHRLAVFTPKPATFGLEAAKLVVDTDARHLALLVARNLLTAVGDDRLELHQVLYDAAGAGLVDRRIYEMRHTDYYIGIVKSALRDYTSNKEAQTPESGTAVYRRDQNQIDAAVTWLMSQDPSGETDGLLVQFADSLQVMPTAAMDEDTVREHLMGLLFSGEPQAVHQRLVRLSDHWKAAGMSRLSFKGARFEELSALAAITSLKDLSLYRVYNFSDLGPLAKLVRLESLDLDGTHVTNLWPLAGLTGLKTLVLRGVGVSELGALAGLTGLESLDLGQTHVTDLRPLAALTQLKWLNLRTTRVVDLRPLAGLTELRILYVGATPVTDITPLAGLTRLRELDLAYPAVTDWSPLAGLIELEELDLGGTVPELPALLSGLPKLKLVDKWAT